MQNCRTACETNVRACVRIYRSSNTRSAISRIGFAVPTGARAISSAETIEKWVNRSNVFLPAALRLSRAAFSSLAHSDSSVGILTLLTRFSVLVCLSSSLSLFPASILPRARLSSLIAPVILAASYVLVLSVF